MRKSMEGKERNKRRERFSLSLFAGFFLALLLMSGIHVGIIVFMNQQKWNEIVQTIIPMVYWAAVALGLTIYTRKRVETTYEIPMQNLAEATGKVAKGDFSVFVPTINTADRQDYLDVMIMDFNKMVEELGSIETLKTDFISNVSHEIKTPLAVIQGNVEMLRHGNLSDGQLLEYSETIMQATKRLSNLITNILKLNKLEKQTIKPISEVYDLCRQLSVCALQFEEIWEQKKIEFIAEIEDYALVEADSGLLELIWNNLLSNALKFTAPRGTVTLRQFSEAEKIIVLIRDTGCGMDEDTVKRIFDKFYQGDTSHSLEGNGLGLALVRRILDLVDGEISVETAVGAGTTFRVVVSAAISTYEKKLNGG